MGDGVARADVASTIARARGRDWAHQMRDIIRPSSMEWPWSGENGIELARRYVSDLADDESTLDSLAFEVLASARQHWSQWRR